MNKTPSRNLLVPALLVTLCMSPTLGFAQSFTAEAYEQGSNKSKLLYKIVRNENGNTVKAVTSYPDGKEAVVEDVTLQDGQIKTYHIEQKQTEESGQIDVREGKIYFSHTKEGKTKTDDEKLTDNFIIGATTMDFMLKNWPTLLKGEDVAARFGAWDRKETVGFKFFKIGELDWKDPKGGAAEPAIQIKMKPSSIIIAALVNPLVFTVSKDGKRLLELNGRIPAKKQVDGKWKDLDAEVIYHYGPTKSASTPTLPRKVASGPQLPMRPEDGEFFNDVQNLDLGSDSVTFSTSSGGTSAYAKVTVNQKLWGAFLPANSATNPYGEAFVYHLARALGQPKLAGKGKIYSLSGKGFERFKTFMESQKFSNSSKEANRKEILAKMSGADSLIGVAKFWDVRPIDYDAICSGNGLSSSHPLSKFVQSNGPQPSENLISLAGLPGKAKESDLAKQLSTILLLDALTGQWDRFSGGNFQATAEGSGFYFIALDNGGTWGGDNWLKKYLGWVSRYDRQVAENILALNGFLNKESGSFLNFTQEEDLQAAMDMSSAPKLWNSFKTKLASVAAHIESTSGDKFFRD